MCLSAPLGQGTHCTGLLKTSATHLFRRILVLWQPDHLPSHLVDRPYDLQHLVVGDISILVDIVKLECPWVLVLPNLPELVPRHFVLALLLCFVLQTLHQSCRCRFISQGAN